MFAANNNTQLPLLESNVIYFEEKPSTNIQKQQKTKRKKSIKKTRTCKTSISSVHQDFIEVKNENILNKNTDYNDPLLISQIEIKCELSEEKCEDDETESFIHSDNDNINDKDFCLEDCDDHNSEVDEEYHEYKGKLEKQYNDSDYDKNEIEESNKDDQDNESLLILTQIRKRNKRTLRLRNCPKTCKHKCTTKFDKSQRLEIFDYYCQLSDENKVKFLRKHIRKRVMLRVYHKNSRYNYCYFLKHYKIGETPNSEVANLNAADNNLIKVCRCFFKSTLCILDNEVKESFEGYEVQKEKVILPPKQEINKDLSKLPKKVVHKIEKYLDPETGTLTTTKTKRKRRKPNDPQPERFPKPIQCSIRCKFKCHLNFTEEERKKICDVFWSLDFKRRKDFILTRIETTDVKSHLSPEFKKTNNPRRSYQTKFYLRSSLNSENKRVCKHFLMNTLCTNRVFIENAIQYADKTTGSYVGQDRRGMNSHNKISEERRQIVKDHINSYPFWLPNKKSKIKYFHHSLTIKQMYTAYRAIVKENFVSPKYYSRVLHEDFHIAFLTNPNAKGGGFLLTNPNLSHYTGKELGGFWIDSKGNVLDIQTMNLAQTLNIC